MKIRLLMALSMITIPTYQAFALDWENPPVICPEEAFPKGIPCPDFSKVANVYTDFPNAFTVEDIKDWKNNKSQDLKYCRNKEVLNRETNKPGTYNAAVIENAWMVVNGSENAPLKLQAIKEASLKNGIPPQVLIGAMKQESVLSSLGVSPDGGNYSCGMSQLNIQEWCQAMKDMSPEEKLRLDWPSDISCESDAIPTTIVKPFYDLAIKNLGKRPSYQLNTGDFKNITKEQVISSFPQGDANLQDKRFKAISSFVNHCQDIDLSIAFKAKTLSNLYKYFVPLELKNSEQYPSGKTFSKACIDQYPTSAYPLHTGWLLAVAMYNAGPSQAKLIDHYFQVENNLYPKLNPQDLIEALHWGGKFKRWSDDQIVFKGQNGKEYSQKWFKSCIVQRHVARVIQHVTVPAESIAKSLEQAPCTTSGVPDYRKNSSGIKETAKDK